MIGFELLLIDDENNKEHYHLQSQLLDGSPEEIERERVERVRAIIDDDPDISSRKLGSQLGMGKDAALRLKKKVSVGDRQTANEKDDELFNPYGQ